MTAEHPVEAALKEVGLPVDRLNSGWATKIDIPGGERRILLFPPTVAFPYYTIMAPVFAVYDSLEKLPRVTLVKLLRANSEAFLARFEALSRGEGGEIYAASSECSEVGMTGSKLRTRIEACAVLAGKIERLLSSKKK